MLMKYGAYLLRYWGEEAHVRRVEIVHVQTGERVVLGSTAQALAWIDENAQQSQPGDLERPLP